MSDSAVLLGFFDSQESPRIQRPPSTSWTQAIPRSFVGFSVEGPSSEGFLVYPVFRAAGEGRRAYDRGGPHILPDGSGHRWALEYEPREGKSGVVRLRFDGKATPELEVPLDEQRSTRFDRFGIISTWVDGNGQLVYFDDLEYTSRQE